MMDHKQTHCGCADCRSRINNKIDRLRSKGEIHRSQYFDYHLRGLTPKDWEHTMEPEEVEWCLREIRSKILDGEDEFDYACADSFRAARAWKSSQIRRFKKLRTCCGSEEWAAYRWSPEKKRNDKYILGFNFGH